MIWTLFAPIVVAVLSGHQPLHGLLPLSLQLLLAQDERLGGPNVTLLGRDLVAVQHIQ